MHDKRLDRVKKFDEASRAYRAVEGIETLPLISNEWACYIYNDQGREGACVGFAWSHELAARPKVYLTNETFALGIYARAKQIDQWAGEDYSGTSVLAGVKAVMEIKNAHGRRLYGEYRWAFGTEEVLRVLGYRGPVVLGIDWYNNMYYPDAFGFVKAEGSIVGGHAIMANGVHIELLDPNLPATFDNVNLDKSFVRLHNSWGTEYGIGGDAFLTVRDLDKLLYNGGEACIPMHRRK